MNGSVGYEGSYLSGNIGLSDSPVLEEKNITQNGLYVPASGVDGFSKVRVNVPKTAAITQPLTVIQNGSYQPPYGVDGFDDVTVNVPYPDPELQSINITENGSYVPPQGVDGYNNICVNVADVPPVLDQISITENGTYTPPTGVDGYDEISVDVEANTTSIVITENGDYFPPLGVDGYDDIAVQIPLGSKSITQNGTYQAASDDLAGFSSVSINVAGYKIQSYSASDIITFNDGVNLPMLSCVANIEAVQSGSGDPSPTNIRPITGWTGCNVTISGINIANFVNGHGIGNDGMPDDSQNRCGTTVPITIKTNNDYYFTSQDGSKAIYAVWSNGTLLRRISNVSSGTKLNMSDGDSFYICIYNDSTATVEFSKPMVALNNSATYAPYVGSTYSLTWSSQGTIYGGYVDLCSGILTATKALIDMGDMTWTYQSANTQFVSSDIQSLSKYPSSNDNPSNIMCSNYANNSYRDYTDKQIAQSNTGNVFVKDSTYTDATTFKTAMDGVQLVYELATPTTYQLTPSQVKTLLADNVIFADCGRVEAEVWKSL